MPKRQRAPVTIAEMVEMSKGGKRKSEYSENKRKKKGKKKKNPTKDLTIGGAVRKIREKNKKTEEEG